MTKKATIITSILAVAAVCAVAVGIVGLRYYTDHKKPAFTKQVELYVYPTTTLDDILATLDTVIINKNSIRRSFSSANVASRLKPG
ncbi:MAG: hypothetical protein MJZ16_12155, partial [Bacteroidales bacterium]|nr:hypothetical protein [Bacteroidales bacterium]